MRVRKLTISAAVGVLVADVDRRLAARPVTWRGSAEALVLHAGQLYRISAETPAPDGPPHHLTASSITAAWEVLERTRAIEEPVGEEEEAPAPSTAPRRVKSASVRPAGARGRPTVADVIASLPDADRPHWTGVVEAAALLGLPRDKVRRWAKTASAQEVRRIRGAVLVSIEALRAQQQAAAEAPPAPVIEPAPAQLEEVYS